MVAIYRQGESSGGGGRKPKVGARKTENGVELMWNGKGWVKAPNHGKKETTPSRPINRSHGGPKADWGKMMKRKPRKQQYPTASETRAEAAKRKAEADKNTTTSTPTPTPSRPPRSGSNTSTPVRKPPTAPPPVPKGIVEKTGDRYKAKTKKIKERKKYLQTKEGGGLSKRMAAALADKDALKFKG